MSASHFLDPPCGHSGKPAENLSHFNRSCPSDLYTSSPCHSGTTKRKKLDWEKLEEPPNLHGGEKLTEREKHKGQQTDTVKDLPLRDASGDRAELDVALVSSLDRERPPECNSFIKVKRVKHTHPSSHTAPVQPAYITDLSVLYPNSSRGHVTRTPGGFTPYPGAEMHPYRSASWESMWDFHETLDQHALKDFSVNTCKAIRLPLLAQRQKEAFNGFCAPPHFPLALRQETVYLRGREFLHSHHENCCRHQLPHPGFLATSYQGP